MKIETKYNVGDTVYFIYYKGTAEVSPAHEITNVEVWGDSTSRYWLKGNFGYFNDSSLFSDIESASRMIQQQQGRQ